MNGKTAAAFLALASVVLFAAALPRFRAEYASVLFTRLTPDQQLFALIEADVRLPYSIRAERAVLRACETSLSSPLGQFQPEDARNTLRETCAALASEARARAPTSSWANLVVAATTTDTAEFGRAIAQSQATGAFEGELAQRRFVLGLARLDHGGDAFKSALAADVTVLAQISAGREVLVQSYRAYPEKRDFIVSAIENAPESAQSAFVQALRKAGG